MPIHGNALINISGYNSRFPHRDIHSIISIMKHGAQMIVIFIYNDAIEL